MKYKIILIIFIIALISSSMLVISQKKGGQFCGAEDGKGCSVVQNSSYAHLFGISNSIYGVFIFAFLTLITFLNIKKATKNKKLIINSGIIIGSIIALYFIYLQVFVLKGFCKYCMIIDTGMLINLILIIPKRKK